MSIARRFSHSLPALGCGLVMCLCGVHPTRADPPTATGAASAPVPQGNLLSSLTQAFKQDFEHQVVRGHFNVGSAPDPVHRYYCLVDAKTGRRQPNGVAGEPFQRPDGMTGLKGTAVSLSSCAGAEQQGLLVTAGYVLIGGAAAQAAASAPPAAPGAAPAAKSPTVSVPAPVAVSGSPERVDIAGVKLGMSVDEVRAIFKSKQLLDYRESSQTLGHLDPANRAAAPATGAYFVNSVAAWTQAVDAGEAYEVMFTPVPGRERAMAIIHSVTYSPRHALRLRALASGLVKKYGGYTASDVLSAPPTWRVQSDGTVQVGDSCKRRELFAGLADLGTGQTNRPNLALKTTPEEFRYQIDLCGVAIVTEDHVVASDTASHEELAITRFTVTAYSPSIGFEGAAAAAQLMQAAVPADATEKDIAAGNREAATPKL